VIRHLVVFRLKPATSDAVVADIDSALAELPSLIPGLRGYQFGRDVGGRDGNGDYAVTALVDDDAAVTAYLTNEHHLRISRELIAPHVESKVGIQISC
jgi:hypothetical protein